MNGVPRAMEATAFRTLALLEAALMEDGERTKDVLNTMHDDELRIVLHNMAAMNAALLIAKNGSEGAALVEVRSLLKKYLDQQCSD